MGDKPVRGSARQQDCRVTGHVHVNRGSTAAPSSRAQSCHGALHVGGLKGLLSFLLLFPAVLCSLKGPSGRSGCKSSKRAGKEA